MTETQKNIVEALTAELQRGTLTEANLRHGIADIVEQNRRKPQDILYLQASSTSPKSQVVGMLLIEDGNLSEGPLLTQRIGPIRRCSMPSEMAGGLSLFPIWRC